MGRPQSITLPESTTTTTAAAATAPLRRTADVAGSLLLLLLTAPLFALLAVMVRLTSHGPVFHREPVPGLEGSAELLSFRTHVDGGNTEAHARVRAVVGAGQAWTPIGRQLTRLRLDRLPRLVNVLKGDASLFPASA